MAEVSTAATWAARGQAPRPWTQAWIDALPIAPAWVGCAFAAGHVLLAALYFAVFVSPQIGAAWSAYQHQSTLVSTSVFALIIGYATAGLAYARRGHETTLRDLRPALACNDTELSALQREVLRFDMAGLRWAGLTAAVAAMAATYFTTDLAQRLGHPALLWVLWQNALFSWLLTRTIAHDLRVSRVFSQAAQRHAEIELFDLTPLTPLAGRGLQSALLIVLALSLLSLILVGDDVSPLAPGGLTATVLLPVPRPDVTIDDVRRVDGQLRELRYHPERFTSDKLSASPGASAEISQLASQKAHWLSQNLPQGTRLPRHQAIMRVAF